MRSYPFFNSTTRHSRMNAWTVMLQPAILLLFLLCFAVWCLAQARRRSQQVGPTQAQDRPLTPIVPPMRILPSHDQCLYPVPRSYVTVASESPLTRYAEHHQPYPTGECIESVANLLTHLCCTKTQVGQHCTGTGAFRSRSGNFA